MHEMGITQGVLSAAFDAAKEAGASRITEVHVSVGELTEVVEFALQFAFEALTPGTMAEGAVLVINHVGARSACNECGLEYDHDRFTMLCPACGSFNVRLLQGRELTIDSIETDSADEPEAPPAGESEATPAETPAAEPETPAPTMAEAESAGPSDEPLDTVGPDGEVHVRFDPSQTME